MEEEINIFCDKVESYINYSCMTHKSVYREKEILSDLKRILKVRSIGGLEEYTSTMCAYIYYKEYYLKKIGIDAYYNGKQIFCDAYDTKEVVVKGVEYNPFKKDKLRTVVSIIKGEKDELKVLYKLIGADREIFRRTCKVDYIHTMYEDAKLERYNINTKVKNITNGGLTTKEYIDLLKHNLSLRVEMFSRDMDRIRFNDWEDGVEEVVVNNWLTSVGCIKDLDTVNSDIYTKVYEEQSNGGDANSLLKGYYDNGIMTDERLRTDYEYRLKHYEYTLNDQKYYKHIKGMSRTQKIMYVNSHLCNIINGYFVLLRTILEYEGYEVKNDNNICNKSLIYTLVKYIRNVDEHPIAYGKYFEGGKYVFNMYDIERWVGVKNVANPDFDIYFNIDRYEPGLENNGINATLFNNKMKLTNYHIEEGTEGGRLFLVYKDIKFLGNLNLDEVDYTDFSTRDVVNKYKGSLLQKLSEINCVEDFLDDGVDINSLKKAKKGEG